ncbi:MAG: phosphopantetheine-binding protein [Pseudomonadota bacterium]
MTSITPAEQKMAAVLIAALNLENRDPSKVVADAPLFGEGTASWGLDSIDALEIALAIQQHYGVELRSEDEAVKRGFASLRALTALVAARTTAG